MIQVIIKMICSIFMSSNNFFLGFFFFTYIKMSKNSSAKYHLNNKERLQKNLRKDIKVSLKKKRKKQYDCEWYKNVPEDEKQKLVEYSHYYLFK